MALPQCPDRSKFMRMAVANVKDNHAPHPTHKTKRHTPHSSHHTPHTYTCMFCVVCLLGGGSPKTSSKSSTPYHRSGYKRLGSFRRIKGRCLPDRCFASATVPPRSLRPKPTQMIDTYEHQNEKKHLSRRPTVLLRLII